LASDGDIPPVPPNLSVSELRLRLHQQALVARFGRFAMQTDSFQAILSEACAVAAEGLDARFAKVLEYQPGELTFLLRAGVGWQDGVVGSARVGIDLESPAGYAFRTGLPVVSNHLASEDRFRTPQVLADHGIRSAINVLVQTGEDEPFGVLEGDSTHRNDFNDHDIVFLQALANTLGVAVQAQKRADALRDLLREKEELLRQNQALLHDKDLLMQEVHHRVKNSLQLVRTILSMQVRTSTNRQAKEQIEQASGRIMTIAAVHHRLYDGNSVTATDAGQYLRGLLSDLQGLLPDGANDRALELDIESFSLAADDITPLGLVTCELVTNAFKYGRGAVRVAVRRNAAGLEVSVADEGDGFPAAFDPSISRGLGMRLVSALAKAADGGGVTVDRSVPYGRIVVAMAFG
jgi:two-component sensor histidine kinase